MVRQCVIDAELHLHIMRAYISKSHCKIKCCTVLHMNRATLLDTAGICALPSLHVLPYLFAFTNLSKPDILQPDFSITGVCCRLGERQPHSKPSDSKPLVDTTLVRASAECRSKVKHAKSHGHGIQSTVAKIGT